MKKDYISADERLLGIQLERISKMKIFMDELFLLCCLGVMFLFLYELLNGVNYV